MVNSHSGNNHAAIAPGGKSSRRIALICDWFLPRLGGIELHLADLAAALARKGASPVVITSTPNAGAEPRPELTVTRLRVLRAPGFGFAVSPLLVRRLERTLRDGRFDVVHAHVSVISPFAIAALLAARRLNLPAVVTFHSMLLRATDVMQWADRRWGWSASPILLTAVSKLVAEQARVGAGGKEVLVLPNGVDLDFWPESPRPAFEGNDSRRIVFATAMRLAPKKRPMALMARFDKNWKKQSRTAACPIILNCVARCLANGCGPSTLKATCSSCPPRGNRSGWRRSRRGRAVCPSWP